MNKEGCGDYKGPALKPDGTGLDSSSRWLGDDMGASLAGTVNLPSAEAGWKEPKKRLVSVANCPARGSFLWRHRQ